MSEVEKQESQKTVVAFITGLLIGGLLVWVFSSTPDAAVVPEVEKTEKVETTNSETKKELETSKTETKKNTTGVAGEGSVTVNDQKAGAVVVLGTTKFPTQNGWVVVRDYMDGTPGNILGAARYNTDEGLSPTTVELIRETISGSSYQVTFFSDEGNIGFTPGEDTVIEGAAITFKAL